MNKAILIIDMPDGCRECPLCGEDHMTYRDYCRITDQYIWTLDKPDWCPLNPVPEKVDVPDWDDNIKAKNENAKEVGMYMYDRGHDRGYNLCIDKILNK